MISMNLKIYYISSIVKDGKVPKRLCPLIDFVKPASPSNFAYIGIHRKVHLNDDLRSRSWHRLATRNICVEYEATISITARIGKYGPENKFPSKYIVTLTLYQGNIMTHHIAIRKKCANSENAALMSIQGLKRKSRAYIGQSGWQYLFSDRPKTQTLLKTLSNCFLSSFDIFHSMVPEETLKISRYITARAASHCFPIRSKNRTC